MELLAPAGDFEKMQYAFEYGADAVYLGAEIFGLRTSSASFTPELLKKAVDEAHQRGKRIYLTLNIIPHDEDLDALHDYLDEIADIPLDALILSDPGTLRLVRKKLPDIDIHLSTQANCTNSQTAAFWKEQGVSRVILARELSLEEIRRIKTQNPDLELEIFVHGAMCMSYSGRCLISNYLTGRDANRGDCAQSCRWNYVLIEEKRPGEYYPVFEDEGGTAFFNSKDLCALPLLQEIRAAGVDSIKIEGRNKSHYYVASVTRVYREALRRLEAGEDLKSEALVEELKKTSHRDFTLGFLEGQKAENRDDSSYLRSYDFCGVVLDYDEERKRALIEQRNLMEVGDQIEFFGPDYQGFSQKISSMRLEDQTAVERAPHPRQKLWIDVQQQVKPGFLMRKAR